MCKYVQIEVLLSCIILSYRNLYIMKIIVIGAGGAIGKIITPALGLHHEVITVGRSSGTIVADISSSLSLKNLFEQVANVDAVICVAGDSVTDHLFSMNEDKYGIGIGQKLMAQINLVLIGAKYLNDNGSFTLISGKMGEKPAKGSSGKAVANGGVNSFVLAAAQEMPRGIRLNVVSPSKISDINPEELVSAYTKSLESDINGEIIRIGYH